LKTTILLTGLAILISFAIGTSKSFENKLSERQIEGKWKLIGSESHTGIINYFRHSSFYFVNDSLSFLTVQGICEKGALWEISVKSRMLRFYSFGEKKDIAVYKVIFVDNFEMKLSAIPPAPILFPEGEVLYLVRKR